MIMSTLVTNLPAKLPQGRLSTTNFAATSPFGREKRAMVSQTTDAQETDLVSALGHGAADAATAAAISSLLMVQIAERI